MVHTQSIRRDAALKAHLFQPVCLPTGLDARSERQVSRSVSRSEPDGSNDAAKEQNDVRIGTRKTHLVHKLLHLLHGVVGLQQRRHPHEAFVAAPFLLLCRRVVLLLRSFLSSVIPPLFSSALLALGDSLTGGETRRQSGCKPLLRTAALSNKSRLRSSSPQRPDF